MKQISIIIHYGKTDKAEYFVLGQYLFLEYFDVRYLIFGTSAELLNLCSVKNGGKPPGLTQAAGTLKHAALFLNLFYLGVANVFEQKEKKCQHCSLKK